MHWLLEGGHWQLNRPQRKEYREIDDTCEREDRGKRREKKRKEKKKNPRNDEQDVEPRGQETDVAEGDRRCGRKPYVRATVKGQSLHTYNIHTHMTIHNCKPN